MTLTPEEREALAYQLFMAFPGVPIPGTGIDSWKNVWIDQAENMIPIIEKLIADREQKNGYLTARTDWDSEGGAQ